MSNLRRIDPTLDGLALRRATTEAFDSYARYWIESFRLPYLDADEVDRGLTAHGYIEYVLPALESGRGVIVALPHLGGWEWAGRWLADRGHRVTAVVERLDPPELFDWFVKLRTDLGMNVIAVDSSAGTEVLAALKRNEVVCLLCDRDISGTGVVVEFFGEATTLPAGPAMLGLRTGAPVLPTAVYFDEPPRGHHLGIVRPPLDVTRTEGSLRQDIVRITQTLATELEELIRRAPTQWHLFQPNWPSDAHGRGS
jgi:KDO2-lipid IV(A) lauroyltransferase